MEKRLTFKDFVPPIIATIITAVFSVLVFKFDVKAVGTNATVVGFSKINELFHNAIGFNSTLYSISDYLGFLSILGVVIFACIGFIQLVTGGFKGVDKEIYLLGGIFLFIFILYVAFNKLALNYRPFIMPGETELEASFPSSHTLMATTVMGAIGIAIPDYVKNKKLAIVLQFVCFLVLAGTVCCRLFSGVHWVTDIIAGLLISITLLLYFRVFYYSVKK